MESVTHDINIKLDLLNMRSLAVKALFINDYFTDHGLNYA